MSIMISVYPIYKISTDNSKVVVKFVDRNKGYIIDPGTSDYEIGSLHNDWQPHTADYWSPYNYAEQSVATRTPDQLELFETIRLTGISLSTLTKVPNGYVMTSHSGHQLFIKDLLKDSL